jgi:hypothetical protein
MEENLPNSFMGYLLEGPSSLGLRFFQVVYLNSPFQPLGLGLGLNVNVSLSAPKLGVRLQIDKRLWTNGKFQLIRDCGLMENSK